MTGDTMDPYLACIQGYHTLIPSGPKGRPAANEQLPDIDNLLEDMNGSLETYRKMADSMNIHFPDEESWFNVAFLADKMYSFANYYYNNDEHRQKFLPVLKGIDKVFNDMNAALDQHFNAESYTVSRLDFQMAIQDISDRLARRLQIQLSPKVSPRTNKEFKKACEIDKAGPKDALQLLRDRVVNDQLVEKAVTAMASQDDKAEAEKNKKLVLKYWRTLLTNTCHMLSQAHIQYRKLSHVSDEIVSGDKTVMLGYIRDIEAHHKELEK